ncbi:hypothetical protein BD779DRAFT_342529 [Infundibulicybe gibba]|nr:hypothetical protein BD779DRAFT_342529 [Infundibulicybe gibba]
MLYAAQCQPLSKGAKTMISRLMVVAVETGAITIVAACAEGVLMMPRVHSNYYQTITFIIGPLFPNVCPANLNARAQTRRLGEDAQFSIAHAGEGNSRSSRANTTLRFATDATRSGVSDVEMETSPASIFHTTSFAYDSLISQPK